MKKDAWSYALTGNPYSPSEVKAYDWKGVLIGTFDSLEAAREHYMVKIGRKSMRTDKLITALEELVDELEGIRAKIEDGELTDAHEELQGQSGTIQTIIDMEEWK